jgi:hypothetical protein
MKDPMADSTAGFSPQEAPVGASRAEAHLNPSYSEQASDVSNKPAPPAMACAISSLGCSPWNRNSPFVKYSAPDRGWRFEDPCRFEGPLLFRNSIFQQGELFEVISFSERDGFPTNAKCHRF